MAKIVICDDSKTIQSYLERKLRESGHEIVGMAQDGDEGAKLYAERKPDLILLDVTMPNKDGRECLEMILRSDTSAKVIMVSALKDDQVVSECLTLGAKAFISKMKIYDDGAFQTEVLSVIDEVMKAS